MEFIYDKKGNVAYTSLGSWKLIDDEICKGIMLILISRFLEYPGRLGGLDITLEHLMYLLNENSKETVLDALAKMVANNDIKLFDINGTYIIGLSKVREVSDIWEWRNNV